MTVYTKQQLTLRDLDEQVKEAILSKNPLPVEEQEMISLYVAIKVARALDHISLSMKDVLDQRK